MELQHVINLVDDLNRKYYIRTQDDEYQPFEFSSNGDEWSIIFAGETIVCTERDTYDEYDLIENLEQTIIKKCSKIVKNLQYLIYE